MWRHGDALVQEMKIDFPPADCEFVEALSSQATRDDASKYRNTNLPSNLRTLLRPHWLEYTLLTVGERRCFCSRLANKRNGIDVEKWVPPPSSVIRLLHLTLSWPYRGGSQNRLRRV
ncbi:hypothetical protein JAAARDRAFT_443969 [Jaapia argillacea MUCL 33604]|uniref:Uncharacterized protein n=1 Tax=Jaapia argillacea MUCL 33604 TaxID=933084 RepID=A0A067PP32_9AGAM|nr:hypothetical protein JAAARDRAFT_443969 [Jaapia argillacea MUCL 33604]